MKFVQKELFQFKVMAVGGYKYVNVAASSIQEALTIFQERTPRHKVHDITEKGFVSVVIK